KMSPKTTSEPHFTSGRRREMASTIVCASATARAYWRSSDMQPSRTGRARTTRHERASLRGATAVVEVLALLHLGLNTRTPAGVAIAKRDGLSPDSEQVLVEVGGISRVGGLSQRFADPRRDGFATEGVAVCVPQDELTHWSWVYPVLDAPKGKE